MKRQTLATGKKRRISESPAEAPEIQQGLSERTKSVLLASGILIALVVLCYANSLANGFVFDDHGHLLGNKLVRSVTNAPKLLVTAERPLRDISYALDFSLWGERAFG